MNSRGRRSWITAGVISPGALMLALALRAAGSPAPGSVAATAAQPSANRPPLVIPAGPDVGVDSLPARAAAQRATTDQFKVFYGFTFEDRVRESGITFVHRIVDDAGLFYEPVHYDHGNGVAVADVDGDGVEDVYFVNQIGGNELWKNLGRGTFRNITVAAGVALADRIGVAASFADVDNDGDQDLFVTTVRGGNALFENDGRGHFRDISRSAGVDYVGHSSGAVFFDYDNDGLLDLFVCNVGRYTTDEKGRGGAYKGLADGFYGHLHGDRSEPSILYRNMGRNQFRRVTDEVGLGRPSWSGDASVADLNGDGFPDLYLLDMQGSDHYYENVGGRTFVEKTAEHFPRTPWGSMGIKVFDYDNDGLPDVFVTDMHSDMSVQVGPLEEKRKAEIQFPEEFLRGRKDQFIFGNALYRNLGSGRFEEVSDRTGVETYWPWGTSVGDVNADGWQDAFVTAGMAYPFRYGINSLLLNNRGAAFLDSEFLLGLEPRRGGRTHTPWFDFDCSTPSNTVCPPGTTGPVSVVATLGSRSSAMFDLDQDGDLDIITNDFNSEPQILVSNLAQQRGLHWLKVDLIGTVSNRNGLGAKVRVSVGGRALTQWNDGKSGYLSQSAMPLYFGLGDATTIDRLEVEWPSGRKQALTQRLGVNTTVRVTEPR